MFNLNLSKFYGKNIVPACKYCLYFRAEGDNLTCDKGKEASQNDSCRLFKYEPTMREPKEAPLLGSFKPEDFQI